MPILSATFSARRSFRLSKRRKQSWNVNHENLLCVEDVPSPISSRVPRHSEHNIQHSLPVKNAYRYHPHDRILHFSDSATFSPLLSQGLNIFNDTF